MKVLLIGSGGREHALAWTLSQSPQVSHIYVAPGNGGTARAEKCENVEIAATDVPALTEFAVAQQIDLTVVGPEAPLVAGVTDALQAQGVRVFGPTQAAAQLEGSKAFAKEFMVRHGIPTAASVQFTDFDEATRYLRGVDDPPVIKASGLAAGKGVILPITKQEAAHVLNRILNEGQFGEAGSTVLLEERLRGTELSVLAFCDGEHLHIMPPAQDHKRVRNSDQGPNTGGMGAFTPSPLVTPELLAQVEAEVLRPTLEGMAAEGAPYRGVLYAGLMLTKQGMRVLEFNCRFGDPETQVVLPLLESDLAEIFLACAEGRLDEVDVRWRSDAAVTVVMASGGYPGEYTTGVEITGVEDAESLGCTVFHAGTRWMDERLLTDGGRVLAVTALGDTVTTAANRAYAGVGEISFNEAHYRTDIGRSRRR